MPDYLSFTPSGTPTFDPNATAPDERLKADYQPNQREGGSRMSKHYDQPDKLRITYENHGRTNIVELPFDAPLPEIVQKFCNMLVANGWNKKNVAGLFEPEDGESNDPWEWSV